MRAVWSLALVYATVCFAAPQGSPTVDPVNLYTATDKASVEKARQTALTRSPTSNVKGKAFDRFVIIWNENTDYDKAVGDPNLKWLAQKGITLSNNNAVTHPSEPNYISAM
jgi:acid phosphatase